MAIPYAIKIPAMQSKGIGLVGVQQLSKAFVSAAKQYYETAQQIEKDTSNGSIGDNAATKQNKPVGGTTQNGGGNSQSAKNGITKRELIYGSTKLKPDTQQRLRSSGSKVGGSESVPNRSGQNRNRRRNRDGSRQY